MYDSANPYWLQKVRSNKVYISIKQTIFGIRGIRMTFPFSAGKAELQGRATASRLVWVGLTISACNNNLSQNASFTTVKSQCGRPWVRFPKLYVVPSTSSMEREPFLIRCKTRIIACREVLTKGEMVKDPAIFKSEDVMDERVSIVSIVLEETTNDNLQFSML